MLVLFGSFMCSLFTIHTLMFKMQAFYTSTRDKNCIDFPSIPIMCFMLLIFYILWCMANLHVSLLQKSTHSKHWGHCNRRLKRGLFLSLIRIISGEILASILFIFWFCKGISMGMQEHCDEIKSNPIQSKVESHETIMQQGVNKFKWPHMVT